MTACYVQVLIDLDAKALDRRTFTYAVPEGMANVVQVGMPVSVPFGRMKVITGFVVGFTTTVEPGMRIKEIIDILDDSLFSLEYLSFLDWLADYTGTPLMTVLSTALPTSLVQKTRRKIVLAPNLDWDVLHQTASPELRRVLAILKTQKIGKEVGVRFLAQKAKIPLKQLNQFLYRLQELRILKLQSVSQGVMRRKTQKWLRIIPQSPEIGMTERQKTVMQGLLEKAAEQPLSQALETAQTTVATLEKLAQKGMIEIFDAPIHRDQNTLAFYHPEKYGAAADLNSDQQHAVEAVLNAEPGRSSLLYGVTGSGKTEVYLELTAQLLEQGKSVLVLVPEISLTSHLAKRFVDRFGSSEVVLWHSHLSAGEKIDAWRRIHQGALKIVIGARSAIFTPMKDLGLIVMDEAHEASYKQDSPAPRYSTRIVAEELVRRTGAKLVAGSATPDVEAFWQAQKGGLLRLPQRYGGRSMAEVDIIDMKKSKGALSQTLMDALADTISQGHQAILLLNRRGFYTLIICSNCQEIMGCPHCDVALTFHRSRNLACCHYCGYEVEKPQYCKHCASFELTFTGLGTQRLEEDLKQALPDARLLRLDSDVMQKKNAHHEVFEAFRQHQADILIGTQMIAKGLDIPNVTLVGVISADSAFNLPDFKATERGFQLLTQVAGRSGRGDHAGKVIIQTIQPEHPVILRAKDQDYEGFYEDELSRRQEFDFPPYSQLFRLLASTPDAFQAMHFLKATAINLMELLQQAGLDNSVTLLGPAPCVISRIQGRYRYQLMLKNKGSEQVHRLITQFYQATTAPENLNFILDVDAQSFL